MNFPQAMAMLDRQIIEGVYDAENKELFAEKPVVHLHTHSHYSVLDGLATPDEIVRAAKKDGAPAVAITDHGSISALPEFIKSANEHGVKPIIGVEFYVVDTLQDTYLDDNGKEKKLKLPRYHLTVLAKNWQGVECLFEKLTLANEQKNKRPLLTFDQVWDFHDCVVMSACASGILAHDDWEYYAERFKTVYGEDFYLEVMPHDFDGNIDVVQKALKLHPYGYPLVATCDAHYVGRDDQFTQEIMLAVQRKAKWHDKKRWKFDCEVFMANRLELYEKYNAMNVDIDADIVEEALDNTVAVADKCNVELPEFEIELPFESEDGRDAEQVLKDKINAGWKSLILPNVDNHKMYYDRLVHEFGTIKRLGYIKYFLIVEDFISYARKQGITIGPGRGSGAGSLVCYLLGITQLDPIKHGLLFERFLNPDRADLPDIDVDFQDNRRHEVFEYIRQKYGSEYTANIGTFGYLTVKSAFRDVASVFDVPSYEINTLSKLIEDADSFEEVPELSKFAQSKPTIVEQAKKLDGVIRSEGTHAAGMVISSRPIKKVGVVERRKDHTCVNWDKRECEHFGLLKVDILGLSTLTVLDYVRQLVREQQGVDVDYEKLPLNDEQVYEQFKQGNTVGIFQYESRGISGLLKSIEAGNFDKLVAANALYRPGPLGSGLTEQYIKVAQGKEPARYPHKKTHEFLAETGGVFCYQEQVMRIFTDLANFTMAEADYMRKIMGKKLGDDAFEKYKEQFVQGCAQNDIEREQAEHIFQQIKAFAGYAFNRCFSGDSYIVSGHGQKRPLTIREMYKVKNDQKWACKNGHSDLHDKYKRYGYGTSLSHINDRLMSNGIVDIYFQGYRDVYMITTKDGKQIKVTSNHKMMTDCGFKTIDNGLSVGDIMYVKGSIKKGSLEYKINKSEIIAIDYVGVEDVYDVEMAAPNHTLVVNGVVAANSHSAAYALIAYWSMYMKVYYPLEYMTALFTYNGSEKRIPVFLQEVQRLGLEMRNPDINISTNQFIIHDGKIVAPLNQIKHVGDNAVNKILEARQDGVFLSFDNFVSRVNRRVCNKRVQAKLKEAGAFESLGVRDMDAEDSHKKKMALIGTYNVPPSLSPEKRIQPEMHELLFGQIRECAGKANIFEPFYGSKPSVMVINKPVKNEKKVFDSNLTQYLRDKLKEVGITKRELYYTNYIKCQHKDYNKISKECMGKCVEHLKQEIHAVRPKLIVCCATDIKHVFTSEKVGITELNGRCIYSEEFDCYVLFSISPQYALFRDKQEDFDSTMEMIGEIFK